MKKLHNNRVKKNHIKSGKPSKYSKTDVKKAEPKKFFKKQNLEKVRSDGSVRINKYLADIGISTRKGADDLIEQGVVMVNGNRAGLGQMIKKNDVVTVLGQDEFKNDYHYYLYNKPRGILTMGANGGGDREIRDIVNLPDNMLPIGRLDKDSSGLIVLTNDKRVTNRLLSPKYEHEKEYAVEVNKDITNTLLAGLKKGVMIGYREKTKPALVKKTTDRKFDIVLKEGKNRQIRRMCKSFGFEVVALRRFRIMNLQDEKLRVGETKEITGKKLVEFLKLLGI